MSYEEIGGWTDWLKKGAEYGQKLVPIAEISGKVISDPYLPEIACEVTRLSKAQAGMNPGPRCSATVTTSTAGIGLRYAVTPLRVYIWHREHPWVLPAAGIAGLALLYYAGYESGKRSRR